MFCKVNSRPQIGSQVSLAVTLLRVVAPSTHSAHMSEWIVETATVLDGSHAVTIQGAERPDGVFSLPQLA
ncbi:MAG: hypothetical protein OXB90_10185 [Acidimicrobiaceae bacterium]|nr:hypothetical protein [Acidimicrobiaceae bacterium]